MEKIIHLSREKEEEFSKRPHDDLKRGRTLKKVEDPLDRRATLQMSWILLSATRIRLNLTYYFEKDQTITSFNCFTLSNQLHQEKRYLARLHLFTSLEVRLRQWSSHETLVTMRKVFPNDGNTALDTRVVMRTL
ncbi:hypothetical protein TNCV_123611 [Trichonephila clavipes]|nr:hypothetical protein TNCV_123611 [Trichonephila clavipes]